ncbi:hypothetical protein [Lentzea aerocolonigenes]|uniref:hypothetical protein n=1 Tax=Lentzea aerocolonigenes TaxID=68170 RepID=UPI000B20AA58|nr:hypothetical protein [Lentzea aerocolonigenes]MCP2247676.1 hypothetical protein [Lentzea aerocolonigenes]
MFGPTLLARFLQQPGEPDKYGNRWQYHPRSDRHSKVGCWGIAFDLLDQSSLLRTHAEEGKIVLGVNHSMTDFSTNRKKKLDLVIARPGSTSKEPTSTFAKLADDFGIPLTHVEREKLSQFPDLPVAPVSSVLIALEAKACMTEHTKARPRLYDELNSSHLCIHGATQQAIAIGYVQVNAATEFLSPTRNNFPLGSRETEVSRHNQPRATEGILQKIREIPRRSASSEVGFDSIGITVLNFRNDGGPVDLVENSPAPGRDDSFYYDNMISRVVTHYASIFARI